MDKIYVQLSRTGDICNIIPIAYAAHQRGEKVGIMACTEFSSILDGCSYIEKVEFDGKPWMLAEAVEQAKSICKNVVVTQVNAPIDLVKKYAYEPAGQKNAATDSFSRESWKLANCLVDWGRVPLVFDKRDKEREKLLMPKGWFGAGKKKKIILLSASSVSSPFPYRDLLIEMVRLKYPNFNIIDLSEIKAERFYDLLGLYEAAHFLISVDTAHLHLAPAVPNLPVMALIQDRFHGNESYWHGSAWRPSHLFHCRYHDFPKRALELFTAIDNIPCKPADDPIRVYFGSVQPHERMFNFPIQPGACQRDSVNVLGDKERFPMLRDVLRMAIKSFSQDSFLTLCREDVNFENWCPIENSKHLKNPIYAWRMNRDKNGNDTFFPTVDLFAAPVEFWVKIFNSVPDVVMDTGVAWSRILLELFRMNGAKEVGGVYRHE